MYSVVHHNRDYNKQHLLNFLIRTFSQVCVCVCVSVNACLSVCERESSCLSLYLLCVCVCCSSAITYIKSVTSLNLEKVFFVFFH